MVQLDEEFNHLLKDIKLYRQSVDESIRNEFDNEWVYDSSNLCFSDSPVVINWYGSTKSACNYYRWYLFKVLADSNNTNTSSDTKDRILRLFICDIIGKYSSDGLMLAKYIRRGDKSNFSISSKLKLVIILFFIGVNCVVLYFSVVVGRSMNSVGIKNWLAVSLIGIVLDLFIFEICEKTIINVMLPSIIRSSVERVKNVVFDCISRLNKDILNRYNSIGVMEENVFSISKYFFASTRIAKNEVPSLETAVVLMYRDPLPGTLRRPLNQSSFFVITNIGMILCNLVKSVYLLPISLQRIFIEIIILGLLYLVTFSQGEVFYSNTALLVSGLAIVCILLTFCLFEYYNARLIYSNNNESSLSSFTVNTVNGANDRSFLTINFETINLDKESDDSIIEVDKSSLYSEFSSDSSDLSIIAYFKDNYFEEKD